MIYLKKFLNHTLYETYINGDDAVFPNVSICATEGGVYYNSGSTPPTPPTPTTRDLICTYVPTSSGGGSGSGSGESSTKLFDNFNSNFADSIESMTIDGNEQSIVDWYDFGDENEHTVVFTLKDSVTSIADSAFDTCTNLTSITIPNSVTSIGGYTFYCCDNLASIDIPDSVISIGNNAFQGCSSLNNAVVNAVTPPTLGDDVFYEAYNCTIYVPSESVNTYEAANGWSDLAGRIKAIQ